MSKRIMTMKERFTAMKLLEDNLEKIDERQYRYINDFSDKKIADQFNGVQSQTVSSLRREIFGQLFVEPKPKPAHVKLEDRVNGLEQWNEGHRDIIQDMQKRVCQLEDGLRNALVTINELQVKSSRHSERFKSFEALGERMKGRT